MLYLFSPTHFINSIKRKHSCKILYIPVIFLPARPASQTHDSHKGRMILNHVNPAGRIKNCGKKSAFNICNFRFECFFLLAHRVLNNIGKDRYRNTPHCIAIITSLGKHVFSIVFAQARY